VPSLKAQQLRVEAMLDSARMRIGEQVHVDLYLNYDANLGNIKIEWPKIGDTLAEKIDVVSTSAIDTTFPNKTNSNQIFQHQQITISVYDSGYFAIPPFKFMVNDGKDSVYTNSLFIEVHTIPVDTTEAGIKDIKEPFGEQFRWSWYLPYIIGIGGGFVALLLLVLLILRLTRKQRILSEEDNKPKVPPHITALEQLNHIKHEAVWKEGKTKEYYSAISDAIRLYIEGRFELNALESTTDEIMTAFRTQVLDRESKDKLQQLLTLSDLVKFAKMTPIEVEHDMTLQHAFDFVNGTLREEIVENSEPNPTTNL
jgi:hypothetical protein